MKATKVVIEMDNGYIIEARSESAENIHQLLKKQPPYEPSMIFVETSSPFTRQYCLTHDTVYCTPCAVVAMKLDLHHHNFYPSEAGNE